MLLSDIAGSIEISDVCFDSRRVTPGALFVAIPGAGRGFVEDALERGASVVVTDRDETTARQTLALLSSAFFKEPSRSLRLVGVTGTNGKTTVTTLAKQIYETVTGKPAGLIGSAVNLIGREELPSVNTTPESRDLQELLARMRDAGCAAVFMEVSSHSLELFRVHGLRFEIGLLTNLTPEHLDFHGSMENYLRAKLKLFTQSDVCMIDRRIAAVSVGKPLIVVDGSDNKSMALELCVAMGLPRPECESALKLAMPAKGRNEIVPTPGLDITVLIDYAVTPDALEFVLTATRREYPDRKLTLLFGCGGDRDTQKRPVMGGIAARLADRVVVTSDNPRTEEPDAIIRDILAGISGSTPDVIPNRAEAIRFALDSAVPGEVVILCGKGHETYQIIGKQKHHLDEREIVADFLRTRTSK